MKNNAMIFITPFFITACTLVTVAGCSGKQIDITPPLSPGYGLLGKEWKPFSYITPASDSVGVLSFSATQMADDGLLATAKNNGSDSFKLRAARFPMNGVLSAFQPLGSGGDAQWVRVAASSRGTGASLLSMNVGTTTDEITSITPTSWGSTASVVSYTLTQSTVAKLDLSLGVPLILADSSSDHFACYPDIENNTSGNFHTKTTLSKFDDSGNPALGVNPALLGPGVRTHLETFYDGNCFQTLYENRNATTSAQLSTVHNGILNSANQQAGKVISGDGANGIVNNALPELAALETAYGFAAATDTASHSVAVFYRLRNGQYELMYNTSKSTANCGATTWGLVRRVTTSWASGTQGAGAYYAATDGTADEQAHAPALAYLGNGTYLAVWQEYQPLTHLARLASSVYTLNTDSWSPVSAVTDWKSYAIRLPYEGLSLQPNGSLGQVVLSAHVISIERSTRLLDQRKLYASRWSLLSGWVYPTLQGNGCIAGLDQNFSLCTHRPEAILFSNGNTVVFFIDQDTDGNFRLAEVEFKDL